MVDTDDTRRTTYDGRRTTPRVWHKLPTGELKKEFANISVFFNTMPILWYHYLKIIGHNIPQRDLARAFEPDLAHKHNDLILQTSLI